MGKKTEKYKVSPALMYSGMLPALRRKFYFPFPVSKEQYVYFWFNDVRCREKFEKRIVEKGMELADYERFYVHINELETKEYRSELHTGQVIYKVKKRKLKAVPLLMLHEFYQQFGEKVVDN